MTWIPGPLTWLTIETEPNTCSGCHHTLVFLVRVESADMLSEFGQ